MFNAGNDFYVCSNPNKGAERFIEMTVTMHSEILDFSPSELDPKGREKFAELTNGRAVLAHSGTLMAAWKSQADREACKEYQTKRGRWRKVEKYAAEMLAGATFPRSIFVHPSITARVDAFLVPIDGARRLMAHLEAGIREIPVLILMALAIHMDQLIREGHVKDQAELAELGQVTRTRTAADVDSNPFRLMRASSVRRIQR